jgi:hypothetical protein
MATKEPWEVTKEEYLKDMDEHYEPIIHGTYVGNKVRWKGTSEKAKEKQKQTILRGAPEAHAYFVRHAVESGKDVPMEVLKDYPELRKNKAVKPEPLPATMAEYNASPYWSMKQSEYKEKLKPFQQDYDEKLQKLNNDFMGKLLSLKDYDNKLREINNELNVHADKIRDEMGILNLKTGDKPKIPKSKNISPITLSKEVPDLVKRAWEDWRSGEAYAQGNNYRIKSRKGRIASWNKAVKEYYGTGSDAVTKFHNDAMKNIPEKPKNFLISLENIHENRSDASKVSDEAQDHSLILDYDSPMVEKWKYDQGLADIRGIDTKRNKTKQIKHKAKRRVNNMAVMGGTRK